MEELGNSPGTPGDFTPPQYDHNAPSGLKLHAEREFEIMRQQSKPDNPFIVEPFAAEIIALVEKVGKSGQSGGSIGMTTGAIVKAVEHLLMYQPILPLTGEDDEWVQIKENTDDILFQNKRLGAVFKDGDGICTYVDAIVWRTEKGAGWSGSAYAPDGKRYTHKQIIKSFPFVAKTFAIDVTEVEIAPDDWEFRIKDMADLDKVFEYYNPLTPHEL